MKKTVSILLVLSTLALLLCSCGAMNGGGFSFKAKGVTMTPNANAADAVNALGDPISYNESPSCAFTGTDKVYVYNGFMLYTYPKNNTDYILKINLTSDSVSTPEGIKIGSTKSAVVSAYGEGSSSGSVITYTKGKTQLKITFNGETVKGISYEAITN